MRILVVCQYYYPEPFRITDICETLVQKGHQVTVLTGLPNYPEGEVLDEYRWGRKRNVILNGVEIIRCFEIGRGRGRLRLFLNYLSFALSGSLKARTLTDSFDVVFVNQLSPVMMALPAITYKRKHHKKILLYCLDLWPESLAAGGIAPSSFIYKIFLNISRRIYGSTDKILVTSSMFKDYFANVLSMDTQNIGHLPQYAEDIFFVKAEQPEAIAEQGSDAAFHFVFAGNIGEMQSVDTIVRAANELRNHKNIVFHIVGDGAKLDNCKDLAQGFGLENIQFYSRRPVEEMPHYYSMASAMLITLKDNKALSYTLPGKIQSYMAASKPIIGAINGETARVIREAGCGLCCAAEDYNGLADLILRFINSGEQGKMAANAQRYYSDNFSKDGFSMILEDELMALVN